MPTTAKRIALPADESKTLADEYLWIPAADRLDVAVALIIDVVDDDADLIDVAGEHDRRTTVALHFREAVAGDVAAHLRELLRLVAPDFGGRGLEARRSGSVEQLLEEGQGFGGDHAGRLGNK